MKRQKKQRVSQGVEEKFELGDTGGRYTVVAKKCCAPNFGMNIFASKDGQSEP
jgi:hypothetical protein